MKKPILTTLATIIMTLPLWSQTINEDSFNHNFTNKIKQIDEFIDRFNNKKTTIINKQYKIQTGKDLDRLTNLKGLFNQEKTDWNYKQLERFVQEVIKKKQWIDFYDTDWYAHLVCSFWYLGLEQKVCLTLQNQLQRQGGSKWVIISVKQDFLADVYEDIPASLDTNPNLNPMSHATDFLGLSKALEDKDNLANYFDSKQYQPDLLAFKQAIKSGQLRLLQVDKVSYHLLQISGWTLELNQFIRNSPNAGWLISNLQTMSKQQKEVYKLQMLNLVSP